MATRNRLAGHGLVREGAPHDDEGQASGTLTHGGYRLRGGEGRAKCSCGALSPVLPSSYKRRLWHRDEHKPVARAAAIAAGAASGWKGGA